MKNAELLQEAQNEYQGTIRNGLHLAESANWKPYFDGGLAVEDDTRRAQTAVMLENTRQWLASLDESTRAVQVGGFADYLFPIIRASFTNNPIHDLVSVQPMTKKVGQIFFFNYIVGQTKGSLAKGTRIYDAVTGYAGGKNYSDEKITDEALGVATAGTAQVFALSYKPIRRTTILLSIDAAGANLYARDTGNGALEKISGTNTIAASTVNYETGAITITLGAGAGGTEVTTVTYEYDSEISDNLPQIDIQLTSAMVEARRRAMRIRYSQDAAFDFKQEFGVDADATLVAQVADLIRTEQAREVVSDLWGAAGTAVTTFPVSTFNPATAGYSRIEHFKDFIYQLNVASNAIYEATQRAHGNWIVCDTKAASVIQTIPAPIFQAAGIDNNTQGVQFLGILNGQFRVWKDKLLSSESGAAANGNILMGYKGPDFFDAGYVWAPYQLLYTTTNVTLDDFLTRKGMATRYAKKIINPNLYRKISLT